jgi:hypothetical protein
VKAVNILKTCHLVAVYVEPVFSPLGALRSPITNQPRRPLIMDIVTLDIGHWLFRVFGLWNGLEIEIENEFSFHWLYVGVSSCLVLFGK